MDLCQIFVWLLGLNICVTSYFTSPQAQQGHIYNKTHTNKVDDDLSR